MPDRYGCATIRTSEGRPSTTHAPVMTTDQLKGSGHLLIAPSNKHIVCFTSAGHHQMMMQHYKAVDGGWQLYKGGYNWIGNARSYYSSLQSKGYRKA